MRLLSALAECCAVTLERRVMAAILIERMHVQLVPATSFMYTMVDIGTWAAAFTWVVTSRCPLHLLLTSAGKHILAFAAQGQAHIAAGGGCGR